MFACQICLTETEWQKKQLFFFSLFLFFIPSLQTPHTSFCLNAFLTFKFLTEAVTGILINSRLSVFEGKKAWSIGRSTGCHRGEKNTIKQKFDKLCPPLRPLLHSLLTVSWSFPTSLLTNVTKYQTPHLWPLLDPLPSLKHPVLFGLFLHVTLNETQSEYDNTLWFLFICGIYQFKPTSRTLLPTPSPFSSPTSLYAVHEIQYLLSGIHFSRVMMMIEWWVRISER